MLWNLLYNSRHLARRCPWQQPLYHFVIGTLLALVWKELAQPHFQSLAGNTGEFWFGLFVITGLMLVRSTVWGCLVHLAETPGGIWVAYRGYLGEACPALGVLAFTLRHPQVVDILTHHGTTEGVLFLGAGAAVALLTTPLTGVLLGRALSRYPDSLRWSLVFPFLGIAGWLVVLLFSSLFAIGLHGRSGLLAFPFVPVVLALLGSLGTAVLAHADLVPLERERGELPVDPSLTSLSTLGALAFTEVCLFGLNEASGVRLVLALVLFAGHILGLFLEGVVFERKPFPLWTLLLLLVAGFGVVTLFDRYARELVLVFSMLLGAGGAAQVACHRLLVLGTLGLSGRRPKGR